MADTVGAGGLSDACESAALSSAKALFRVR